MKAFTVLLVVVMFSGCAGCNHARTPSLQSYLPGVREFLAGFAGYASTNQVDYFFISSIRHDPGEDFDVSGTNGNSIPPACRDHAHDFAYAYWMNGNSIIILDDLPAGKLEDPTGYGWYATKARIDLATDVVPTPAEQGTSTYLVSLDWVESIIRDCLGSGVEIVVRKKGG